MRVMTEYRERCFVGDQYAGLEAQSTLDIVRVMILEVMEEEEGAFEIELKTSFQDDLELESIEMVALGESLQVRYDDRIDFAGWLTQLSLDELMALSVRDLVEWIDRSLLDSSDQVE